MDSKLWNLIFGVEVSTRYHDWMRAAYGRRVSVVRGISAIGAILALVTFGNWPNLLSTNGPLIVALAAAVIACANIWDLVQDYDGRARLHTELYRRFKELQGRIARDQESWQEHIAAWEADAQLIRLDEPPTMWAVYAICWNQTIERHQTERQGYYRPVRWWQRALRNLLEFRPQDFPVKP